MSSVARFEGGVKTMSATTRQMDRYDPMGSNRAEWTTRATSDGKSRLGSSTTTSEEDN